MSTPSTPPSPRYRMPAEWELQEAMWFSWPLNRETWPTTLHVIQEGFATLLATISQTQSVYLNCREEAQEPVQVALREKGADLNRIRFFNIPTNDAWCRDHGPVFVVDTQTGERAILNFRYNAWGGKFPPWDLDDAVPARVAEALELPLLDLPLTGEGGGLEVDGRGNMLNTRSVWLNPNRNPDMKVEQVEKVFFEYLGVERTCWLPDGLVGDDTDGHIDTLSRYANPGLVVTCMCEDTSNPNAAAMSRNASLLREFGQCREAPFEVIGLPLPSLIRPENWREEILPATYANFLITNETVLVPTYRQPRADDHALGILREVFPNRRVMGVDCFDLVLEGGALHCISQQMPATGIRPAG